jgi:hypothetical protein
MLRATGFGRPFPRPWARRQYSGGPRVGFEPRSVRMAATIAVAVLLLINLFLVYRLAGEDDVPQVAGVTVETERDSGAGVAFEELREALQSAQTLTAMEIETGAGQGTDRRGEKPGKTSNTDSGSATTGSGSVSTSTGSSSTGSSSGGSDSTDSDSGGGSSGGSTGEDGGDTVGDDTGSGGPGGGGGSGDSGGGGDSGDGGSGGGGGGGGG